MPWSLLVKLDVELGGIKSTWNYAGSLTFQNWLESRPWQQAGGFCVVRTEAAARDVTFSAIQRAAHAIHSDNGNFSVKLVECGGSAGTPQHALMRHFQLTRDPLASVDAMRINLHDNKQLIVFAEQEPVDGTEWERFIALSEYLCKSTKAVPLAIAVLDTRSVLSHEPTCNFHAGNVDLQVFAGATAIDESSVWARYRYLRVWWDVGGCYERAQALSQRCMGVTVGDDDGLESVLQSYAEETVKCHSAWPMLQVMHGITLGNSPQKSSAIEIEAELLEARFLWRPPGLQSLRVAPLAARALLAERELQDAKRWSLRSSLVCGPLTSECLGLCQFFETQIRARLHGRDDRSRLPPAVADRLKEFQDGNDEYVRYPTGHPAPPLRPQDILAFASFGETLTSCPRTAVSNADRRVQHLRNCLAHGHYVTWWHCRVALQLLRSLDVRPRG